jgi:hypothetical protein
MSYLFLTACGLRVRLRLRTLATARRGDGGRCGRRRDMAVARRIWSRRTRWPAGAPPPQALHRGARLHGEARQGGGRCDRLATYGGRKKNLIKTDAVAGRPARGRELFAVQLAGIQTPSSHLMHPVVHVTWRISRSRTSSHPRLAKWSLVLWPA